MVTGIPLHQLERDYSARDVATVEDLIELRREAARER